MEEKCLNLINYGNHHNQKSRHHRQMDDDQLQLSSEGGVDNESTGAAASTTDDATTNEINKIHHHINHIHRHHNRIDSTGTGIFLETPIIEENTISMNSHDYENARPKRLSDEFLSQSTDDDNIILQNDALSVPGAVLGTLKEETDSAQDADDENDDGDEDDEDVLEEGEYDEEEEGSDDEEDGGSEDDQVATDNDVQSMDANERSDLEEEHGPTGPKVRRLSAITDENNCLKLNFVNNTSQSNEASSSANASGNIVENSSFNGSPGTSGNHVRIVSSDSKVINISFFFFSFFC